MSHHSSTVLEALVDRGVDVPRPESVEIGPDVVPERISGEGVTIHAGCRIRGAKTLILPGVELGREAPVSLSDCQLGRGVKLAGGEFHESTFLDGAGMGVGAQVREGCLIEEGARGAHCVGIKQTILFPWATLGSLVNFCDCLMAGGTSPQDHSEVGSSYIHFNYTPNQDKATPSLMGDVPRGVMLREPPIFLGGQGGLVGPVRIAYGTVVAAGTILRKDVPEEGQLVLGRRAVARTVPFRRGRYPGLDRIVERNVGYVAQLVALREWYRHVRFRFAAEESAGRRLLEAATERIERGIGERIRRLGQLLEKAGSPDRELPERLREGTSTEGDAGVRAEFLGSVPAGESAYPDTIRGLPPGVARAGSAWLQDVVEEVVASAG